MHPSTPETSGCSMKTGSIHPKTASENRISSFEPRLWHQGEPKKSITSSVFVFSHHVSAFGHWRGRGCSVVADLVGCPFGQGLGACCQNSFGACWFQLPQGLFNSAMEHIGKSRFRNLSWVNHRKWSMGHGFHSFVKWAEGMFRFFDFSPEMMIIVTSVAGS